MPRRLLSAIERAEAEVVFGAGLDYTRVFVVENTPLPNWIADIGRSAKPNAITLGNVSYFPETLQTSAEIITGGNLRGITWLIHELTHQWQYQHMGWRYLAAAVSVQLREGAQAYNYQREHPSREDALRAARAAGRRLAGFNMEQQGDIARDYFQAFVAANRDENAPTLAPFQPFIAELKSSASR
jgi:hypothetical protein